MYKIKNIKRNDFYSCQGKMLRSAQQQKLIKVSCISILNHAGHVLESLFKPYRVSQNFSSNLEGCTKILFLCMNERNHSWTMVSLKNKNEWFKIVQTNLKKDVEKLSFFHWTCDFLKLNERFFWTNDFTVRTILLIDQIVTGKSFWDFLNFSLRVYNKIIL